MDKIESVTVRTSEQPDKTPPKKTGSNTHQATERGYAFGQLIEARDIIPAGVPISTEWMKRIDGNPELERAVNEALDPQSGDVDLTQLSKAALQAKAVEHGINPGKLSEADLITAIKAAYDKDRTQ